MGKAKLKEVVESTEVQGESVEHIRDAFLKATEAGKQEDDVKLDMIVSGATFKNVSRLFSQFMVDAGLAVSKEDRSKAVEQALTGASFATKEDFDRSVTVLMDSIPGASEKAAQGLVRSYAKKNSLECYVKPKGEASPRSGLKSNMFDYIIANPLQSDEEFTAYVKDVADKTGSVNFWNHLQAHLAVLGMARRVAQKYGA